MSSPGDKDQEEEEDLVPEYDDDLHHHPVFDIDLEDRYLTSCRNGDTWHVEECLATSRVKSCLSLGLVEAARAGHVEVVEMLVSRDDCDVNFTDNDGDTALSHSCCCGHYQVVKILFNCPKLNINISDGDGVSALHKAIANNHVDIVKLLLNRITLQVRFIGSSIQEETI